MDELTAREKEILAHPELYPEAYQKLTTGKGKAASDYFPTGDGKFHGKQVVIPSIGPKMKTTTFDDLAGSVTENQMGNNVTVTVKKNAAFVATEEAFSEVLGLAMLGPAGPAANAARRASRLSKIAQHSDDVVRGVRWVDETADMSSAARRYQDGASGARSNTLTHNPQAPELSMTLPDGNQKAVRMDGVDDLVVIDRKVSVTTFPKSRAQARRQSEALSQNGMTGRWEVPTEAEAKRARKMLQEEGVSNIDVRVVPQ